jgi:hypothetical protein
MSTPTIVLQGDIWRVVKLELPDQHGVLRIEYVIEVTEPKDKDALGVQRWRTLDPNKNGLSDWIMVTRKLLDKLLKAAGEGNAKDI